jgi:uncharacterized membrane protein (Fun14 family)
MSFLIVTGSLFGFGLILGFAASYAIDKNPKILKFLEKLF